MIFTALEDIDADTLYTHMYKEICPVYIENKAYRGILNRGLLWFQKMESSFKIKWEKEQKIEEKYMLVYTAEKMLILPPITDSL